MLPLGRKNARKCSECELTCHANCAHLVPDFCGMSMETANTLLSDWRAIKKAQQSQQPSGADRLSAPLNRITLGNEADPYARPPPPVQQMPDHRYQQQPPPAPYGQQQTPRPARVPVPPVYPEAQPQPPQARPLPNQPAPEQHRYSGGYQVYLFLCCLVPVTDVYHRNLRGLLNRLLFPSSNPAFRLHRPKGLLA